MRRVPSIVLVLLALAVGGCVTVRQAAPPAAEPSPALDVFLLIGQSNMAGRGTVEDGDRRTTPGVYALAAGGGWALARDPLHFDKPRVVGVGPGLAFGKAMRAARPGRAVGLVPGAVGGTSITRWVPGGYDGATDSHPYDDAVARAHAVLDAQGATLAGVLWHHGESDSSRMSADEYETRLVALVGRLRAEFGDPGLPFVAARLAPYYVARRPGAVNINAAIDRLPSRLPATAVVATEGLVDGGDGTHLDAASARELGRRYAAASQRLLESRLSRP